MKKEILEALKAHSTRRQDRVVWGGRDWEVWGGRDWEVVFIDQFFFTVKTYF